MYSIVASGKFKIFFKLAMKRGLKESLLRTVIETLATEGKLPQKYKPHILKGNYSGYGNVIYSLIGCLFGSKTKK